MYDYTNQRFNRLTAMRAVPKDERPDPKRSFWYCQCDCGNIVKVRQDHLKNGAAQSCGCLQKERSGYHDLAGQTFGLLTVINRDSSDSHHIQWLCQCQCGNTCIVRGDHLKSGHTISCGCLNKSKGELKVAELLNDNSISFIEQDRHFINGHRHFFDFFVNNSYYIEFDGKQHFDVNSQFGESDPVASLLKQQERDNEKNIYCREHNMPLIRIPYNHLQQLKIEDLRPETSQFLV